MKKIKKSVWLPLFFLLFGTVFYVYFGITYNDWITNLPNIIIYVVIIAFLYLALRKKEKYEKERNDRMD